MDKKYIAGFITDTHSSKNNSSLVKSIFREAINICVGYNIPLMHGGDFIDHRSRVQDISIKNDMEDVLYLIKDNCIMYGIIGNHDKVDYNSVNSWLSQFKYHPNFYLIETFDYIDLGDFRIHFLSFFKEDGGYVDYLNKIIKDNLSSNKKNLLFTHITISGVNNNGIYLENEDIPLNLFDKFDLVLSGHFHQRQFLHNNKIIYIGSAYQANYGEDEAKGLTLLRSDGELEFVPLTFPTFNKLVIDLDTVSKKELEEDIKAATEDIKNGNNVRFEFRGSETKVKALKKDLFTSNGIDVVTKIKEIEESEIEIKSEVQKLDKETIKNKFVSFCENEELDLKQGQKYLHKILE